MAILTIPDSPLESLFHCETNNITARGGQKNASKGIEAAQSHSADFRG